MAALFLAPFLLLIPALAMFVAVLALVGVTYLVPRRHWGWLLLIGCPLLAFGPVALAALLEW